MGAVLGASAGAALPFDVRAQNASGSFEAWRDAFRQRAAARGVSEATYGRVMGAIKPDTSVYAQIRSQPEFNEALWQYINRRVSDWRIITGKARAKEYAPLLARIEREYGGDRLGRATPPQLLGSRAAQRPRHHRARLERAQGNDRLVGRRHGPYAMDA